MRTLVKTTAAALAAVILFLLVTLPAAPRDAVWSGDTDLQRRTVAGAYHVHTTRSDGAGDRAAVAAAASRAGLGFLVVTDHGDATRAPDQPAYLDGVLCVDGVEISTTGGHYAVIGLGAAPYALGGEPAAVVEDVARLGGFGVAAHPDSARPELAWSDWAAPFDGLEWLNADSEWRNERRVRLARVLFDYALRPGPALASILDRPAATLARWDALTSQRPVVALAAHDAHGGISRTAEGGRRSVLGVPSYEASFRAFSLRVLLDAPPSGDAAVDARALLGALRHGRVFTAIDALATPAFLDFHASRGGETSVMGDILSPGPATLSAHAAVPNGARTVLLRNGVEVGTFDGGTLQVDEPRASGAYRVEVRVSGGPGSPPIPWILSNPIYFLAPPPRTGAAQITPASLFRDLTWRIEKDPESEASMKAASDRVALEYRLRPGSRASQFVALAADIPGRIPHARSLSFDARSSRPMRVSVQLRYASGGGERWTQSVYVGSETRHVVIPIGAMLPADRQVGPPPDPASARSLLFVVDLTNARPGDANAFQISGVGFAE